MKLSTILTGAILAIVIGALVITNPDPDDYARYASQKARIYLSEEICSDLPPGMGGLLSGQCAEIVQSLQPQVLALVRDRTQRLNLGVASIYKTSLSIPDLTMLPQYQIETVGIVNQFLTYRASKIP